MYIDYADYVKLYNDISEADFPNYQYKACAIVNNNTTGVDGVRKLDKYFPTAEYDVMAIKACACEIAHALHSINKSLSNDSTEGKAIASISSGSESVSYVNHGNIYTEACADMRARNALMADICKEFLAGAKDANGVNLLYMGVYRNV